VLDILDWQVYPSKMNIIRPILKYWLPLAAVISMLSVVIYLTVQQDLRIGANEPQVQLAEDAAAALTNQQAADSVVPAGKVDIAVSLAPYLLVYDASGKVLASNAVLNEASPTIPAGVFDFARQHGDNRVTFQPEPGVRSALVIVPVAGGQGGYVVAGRSLREVEKRIDLLGLQVGAGWAGTMLVSLILVAALEILPFTRSRA
jgi:hypothetical protein